MAAAAQVADVVEMLTGLLEMERGSVFRFLGGAGSFAGSEDSALRRAIGEMIAASVRHEGALVGMIEELGGTVGLGVVSRGHQYLAYLSLEYLRPRLVEQAKNAVGRYEEALDKMGESNEKVREVIKRQAGDYREFMEGAGAG